MKSRKKKISEDFDDYHMLWRQVNNIRKGREYMSQFEKGWNEERIFDDFLNLRYKRKVHLGCLGRGGGVQRKQQYQ